MKSGGERRVMTTVFMEHLSSEEILVRENQEPRRILQDISLLFQSGQTWAVSGGAAFELSLLLEIMANIKPYGGGRCVLTERGMMRRKRIVLPHVFYIGSTDMLYENMTVLELLMLAMRARKTNLLLLQDALLELLVAVGCGHISLTPVKLLNDAEKAAVTLTAACLSDSLLIVLNLPELVFDDALRNALEKLSHKARSDGKTLVIGTNDDRLVEAACSHTVFISDGAVLFSGAVEDLRRHYDPVELMVRGDQLEQLARRLTILPAGYSLELREGVLLILNRGAPTPDGFLHELILKTGIIPEAIEVNPRTVKNAYEELRHRHALQAELL
jgi:ABC-2 type transport system ATP-binding protein